MQRWGFAPFCAACPARHAVVASLARTLGLMKNIPHIVVTFLAPLLFTFALANDRPPIEYVSAKTLIPKCKIAVLFNENERAVKESDYMDGAYCLGLVRGVLGTNQHLSPATPLFCLPPAGLKAWQAAKQVVIISEQRPELLGLSETEFAVRALRLSFPCRLTQPPTTG